MKPIIAEDTSEFRPEDKDWDGLHPEELFPVRDTRPQCPDIRNLGVYIQNKLQQFEYHTDRLVGVMHLRSEGGELVDPTGHCLCVRPRWGNVVPMLEEILASDEGEDPMVSRLLQPKVMRWNEWQAYVDRTRGLTAKNSDFLYGVVSDEAVIPIPQGSGASGSVPKMVSDIQNFFEIHEYLQQLELICKRVLKQQSFPAEENLTGRVKGRILVQKQIKYNLSKGRMDRVFCCYNKLSVDNPENRILKYALFLCGRWASKNGDYLSNQVWTCESYLKSVQLKKITPADFKAVKANAAFKDYKRGLELAKRVIQRLSFSFRGEEDSAALVQTRSVRPFFVRMDLLFELYCRVLLRRATAELPGLRLADYSKNTKSLFGENQRIIPAGFQKNHIADMLLERTGGNSGSGSSCAAVLDAKYSLLSDGYSSRIRENTHQLLSYMLLFDAPAGGFMYPIRISDLTILRFSTLEYRIDGSPFKRTLHSSGKRELTEKTLQFAENLCTLTIPGDEFDFYGFDPDAFPQEVWVQPGIRLRARSEENNLILTFEHIESTKQDPPPLYCISVEKDPESRRPCVCCRKDMMALDISGLKDRRCFSIGLRSNLDTKTLAKQIGPFLDNIIDTGEKNHGSEKQPS